jgi:two-component system sensor histidine kinase PilS (NtrC family)
MLIYLLLAIPPTGTALYTVMGIAVSITIPYSLWLRSRLASARAAPQPFLTELILLAGLICLTGGTASTLVLLYPLVILSASIVGSVEQSVKFTLLAILIYLIIATVALTGLPAGPLRTTGHPASWSFPVVTGLQVLLFALFGAIGMYTAARCRFQPRRGSGPAHILQQVLNQLDAGILMLDRKGTILSANPAAERLLQAEPGQLRHRLFPDLCVPDLRAPPEEYGPSVWLERTHAAPVPVALHRTDTELPHAALPDRKNLEGKVQVTLLVLTDLSGMLELRRRLEYAQQVTTAARIAGEMAHEIRTPLTAISASVQLLQHFENDPSEPDPPAASPRTEDRRELFEHILSASERMDTVIRNFVDFAEFSPDDLLSIIKLDSTGENQGYISHINTEV